MKSMDGQHKILSKQRHKKSQICCSTFFMSPFISFYVEDVFCRGLYLAYVRNLIKEMCFLIIFKIIVLF